MSTDANPGAPTGICFGEVTDDMDPTQSRQYRVKLQSGAGQQTDQISTEMHPWAPIMNHSGNPALKGGVGGSLQSLKVGSRVMCFRTGDQDIVILGSVTAAGNGQPDTTPNFNSALPPHAKQQDGAAGISQPNYGDRGFIMTATSTPDQPQDVQSGQQSNPIWHLAQTQLGIGQQGNNALYANLEKDVPPNVPAMNAGGFGQTSA